MTNTNNMLYQYIGIGLFFVLAILGIWWYSERNKAKKEAEQLIEQTKIEQQNRTAIPVNIDHSDTDDSTLTAGSSKTILPMSEISTDTTPTDEDIAFSPNPFLENFAAGGFMSDDLGVTITLPKEFQKSGDTVLVKFNGSIAAKELPKDDPVVFRLFSNKEEDFQQNRSILEHQPAFLSKDDQHQFDFNEALTLQEGRYYLMIELKESAAMLYVDDFIIK